jgi:hypothetical protein
VGTFNNWETTLDPFVLVRPRVWAAAVSGLKAGDYSYQFLLEDGTLTDDADNPLREPDGAGGFLSRIAIPKGKR